MGGRDRDIERQDAFKTEFKAANYQSDDKVIPKYNSQTGFKAASYQS